MYCLLLHANSLNVIAHLLLALSLSHIKPHKPAVVLAAEHGHTEIISRLLHYGADIDEADKVSVTMLCLSQLQVLWDVAVLFRNRKLFSRCV